jgi:pimeloyl-ACP methyl ester carboxylesterase
LGDEVRVVGIDLPGFGDAASTAGYTVAEMAETIASTIAATAPERWILAGHSMGAKVAAAIARAAEDGDARLNGLEGLVLLAGSPPAPEPMNDADRESMLGWFAGTPQSSRAEAEHYVRKNSGPTLQPQWAEGAVADALRMNRAAWLAWLEHGSREDWSTRIGVLHTPALLISGADDENLGPDAQRRLMAPHFANVRSATLPATKHLLPLERPREVARLIEEHATTVRYHALIASSRVGRETRVALSSRAAPDDPDYVAATFGADALKTLRAMIECVIPQQGDAMIDLAARIDRQLALGTGDGWRFAELPADADAYRMGLLTLNDAAEARFRCDFSSLDAKRRASILSSIDDGSFQVTLDDSSRTTRLDAAQMKLWFEDVRADAVRLYVAHPDTLARLGYSGIANGGDGTPKSGFARIGLGEREAWEPAALRDATP